MEQVGRADFEGDEGATACRFRGLHGAVRWDEVERAVAGADGGSMRDRSGWEIGGGKRVTRKAEKEISRVLVCLHNNDGD